MKFGLCCSQPARRPHIGLTASSYPYGREFALRCFRLRLAATPCGLLRLPSSVPVGSFHPTRFCSCWAHWGRRSGFVVCLQSSLDTGQCSLILARPPYRLKPVLLNPGFLARRGDFSEGGVSGGRGLSP